MNDVFVIAEAGVNHNGSVNLALELVNIAKASGADAIKFQTFTADGLVTKSAGKAEYQVRNSGEGKQYDMLKSLELTLSEYRQIASACDESSIEFMSTAFDNDSLDFLIELGIKRVKVPSGELTNLPFISYIASKNLPIILSTGMATLDEVADAVEVIASVRNTMGLCEPLSSILTILHCTSNYPAKYEEVNLRAMDTMLNEFDCNVGYSDHTLGSLVSIAAVSMGAIVIEKHFTSDKKLPGPDHVASLEPAELNDFVQAIRNTQIALGSRIKEPGPNEIKVKELVRRSVVVMNDIKKGDLLGHQNLCLMRPGNGISPKYLDELIGKTACHDLFAGDLLSWDSVE